MTIPSPPAPPTAPAVSLDEHDALPVGTRFGEFEILRVLGVGGFGIVYLAQDHSLERQVALKEYMPAAFASRGQGPVITVRSGSFAETYAIGLRSFINEARLLARFDHPSLVKVYRFWEDNATAYMVMPYLQGVTLREARRAMTQPPDEAWMRSVIDPLLSALEQLHREGVYHRDIAPDNVLLPPGGAPVLLDFGAARRVIGDRTQSLTAILKPSYAPIEQYAEMAQLRQGPWTDLYALGAVMHYLLFGVPPAPATARAIQDDGAAIEQRQVPGVSQRFIAAVAWALAVRPNGRPQNVEALRAALDGRLVPPSQVHTDRTVPGNGASRPGASSFEATQVATAPYSAPTQLDPARTPAARTGARAAAAPVSETASAPAPAPASTRQRATARVAKRPRWSAKAARAARPADEPRSKLPVVAAALVAVAVLAGVAFWQFGGSHDPAPPADGFAASSAAPIALVASVPASASALEPSPSLSGSAVAAVSAGASPASPAAASAASAAASATARIKPAFRAGVPRPAIAPPGSDDHRSDPGLAEVPPAPAPLPDASAAASVPAGPKTAREVCGRRVFIALAICMDRECEKPQFQNNPDCVPVLAMKRSREPRN